MIGRFPKVQAGLLLAFLTPGGLGAEPCRRVALDPAPEWVTAGTWSADGRELVLASSVAGKLLRYSKGGRLLGEHGRPERVRGEYKPSQVHAIPEGLLVRNRAYEWIWLDRHFKTLNVVGHEGRPRFAVVDEVLQGGDLLGLGTLQKADGSWFFGFLRVRLKPLEAVETIEEIAPLSKGGSLHRFLGPTVAVAAGTPYALRFAEPSYLLNLRTRKRLRAFPSGFGTLPALPPAGGPEADVPTARAIARAALPVALHGSASRLYLLTRQPAAAAETSWRLHKIDPVKDVVEGGAILPTAAHDLRLVPGGSNWAVLEKKALTASGRQRVPSVLLIEAAAIEKGGLIPCE